MVVHVDCRPSTAVVCLDGEQWGRVCIGVVDEDSVEERGSGEPEGDERERELARKDRAHTGNDGSGIWGNV